ncbi:uncharacterized protein LOC113280042 [Papaver somniferum]|uniref:uncharacterized protein LOC113280042 n=1 Tax=Papaver somniferum TaxID=3469 RepID=UPI000E6F99BE|nr:uncharacterized protein LOC113280042 [Papaver somniferum]
MMATTVQQQRSFISHINPNLKLSSYSFRIQSQAHNIPRRRSISIPPSPLPKGLGRIGAGTPFLYSDHHHQHRGSKNNNIFASFSASNQEEKKQNPIQTMMATTVQQQRSFISHINPNLKLSSYSFRIQSQAHNIPRRRSISIPPSPLPKGLGRIGAGTPFLYSDHHHQHRGSKNNNIFASFSASNQEEKKQNPIQTMWLQQCSSRGNSSQAHNIPRRRSISIPPSPLPKGLGRIGAGTPFLYSDHHHQHRGSKNNNIFASFSASNQEEKKPDEIDAEKEKNEVKAGAEGSAEASEHKHEEKEKSGVEAGAEESEEAWKHMLESFKEQALKMQDISQEAYELYSKRAAVILKETSEKLKIQAEKSSLDLSRLAKDISVEGKEYLSTVAEKSPEQVKDIVETFATSSEDDWKNVEKVPHFFLGIPYGAFLCLGGFLSFMLTGSVSGIRFGTILGGALLALSISSLRSWKKGQTSALALKGEAVIAAILFLRPLCMFFQGPSFSSFITAIISGYMVAFFIYKIVLDGKQKKGPA